jgi:hypothetical protein
MSILDASRWLRRRSPQFFNGLTAKSCPESAACLKEWWKRSEAPEGVV